MITSDRTKQVAIIELTVPVEERVEISEEIKRTRYAKLEEKCRRNNWKPMVWTIEVGCRGFAVVSASRLLWDFGCQGRQKKELIRKLEVEAVNGSQKIWR